MRPLASSASIGLLLWILAVAPFVHVHSDIGHDGGSVVHGHLPSDHHARHAAASGPSIDAADHEGHYVDVFSSVSPKSDPQVVALETAPDLTPLTLTPFQGWSDDPGWKRGPPPERSSPRAPPHPSLAV